MNPSITVITPIFNCESYVAECLQSLKRQNFADFEVYCIDDASTDNSLAVAKAAVSGDARFNFIVLAQNGGQGAARNKALDAARGDIVVFLDADDYFEDEALAKIYTRMAVQNLDDLYYSTRTLYEDADAYEVLQEDLDYRASFDGVGTGQELFCFFQEKNQWMPHVALRAVRKSLIDEYHLRFPEGHIYEDMPFGYYVSANSKRSSFLNEPIYVRRARVGSTMARPKKSMRDVQAYYDNLNEMNAWVRAHAGALDVAFLEASARQFTAYRSYAGQWWNHDLDEGEKRAFLSDLGELERFEFISRYADEAQLIEAKEYEYLNSKTYKVGNALLRGPRALRNAAQRFKKIH